MRVTWRYPQKSWAYFALHQDDQSIEWARLGFDFR
jgi:hypothetical protein